jgi:YqaJ-like viral recombinase domain
MEGVSSLPLPLDELIAAVGKARAAAKDAGPPAPSQLALDERQRDRPPYARASYDRSDFRSAVFAPDPVRPFPLSSADVEATAEPRPEGPAVSTAPHLARIVADSTDRVAWLRARSRGITATDVAKLSTPGSIKAAALSKLNGSGFGGNSYTDHGRAREPEIAAWVDARFGITASSALFHAAQERRHLATPDGVALRDGGQVELCEIKTTNKGWRSIPRGYLRQVWWQQYVLGAERTLVVWERHNQFVPVGEPQYRWVDRDEDEIAQLLANAAALIDMLARMTRPPDLPS